MAYLPGHPPGDWSLLWSFVAAKRRTILRGVLTMVIAGVAVVSILMLLEVPARRGRARWACGRRSQAIGPARSRRRPDDGSQLFLSIRGWVPRRGRPYIEGRARLCDRSNEIRDFTISGRPDNWRGTRFHVSMSSAVEQDSRLGPGELQGEWKGDAIRATGVLVSHGPVATAEVSRSSGPEVPPQVHYALRRGSEGDFLAACQRLTRRD